MIDRAVVSAQESIADLDLYVMAHADFGKGIMKKFKMSPDAFIQIALQLAYYRVRREGGDSVWRVVRVWGGG